VLIRIHLTVLGEAMSSLLDSINGPEDVKKLSPGDIDQLASEIREIMIERVSENGGHLASSLGVVELTIALHRVFDSPRDKIIFDVGHQSYPHKLLTGRKNRFDTLRQLDGLSGFPVRSESPHDAFGTGHAGTSVSAATGMAIARDLAGQKFQVVAVIGDGSIGAGMALEAVNHAGHLTNKIIVILNDNGMSISPSVGSISRILNQVRFDARYETARQKMKKTIRGLPFGESFWSAGNWMKGRLRRAILPGAFWEELGFAYVGPVDGYNMMELEKALNWARDFGDGPIVVHVMTKKGKGYAVAEADATKFHGVSPKGVNSGNGAMSYSKVFGDTMVKLMQEEEKIVAISAAMVDGTGLLPAKKLFPDRVLDVGICEQHAVTMAAGLATEGFVPVVALYSTFLQRAYDQIVHDVCLQGLPVVFAIDRAGIVGDDGKTHQGSFDISFLRTIPQMIIAAPKDEDELRHLLYTAVKSGKPMAVRYPRGHGQGVPISPDLRQLPIGKGELLQDGGDVGIVAIGTTVNAAMAAARGLQQEGIECAVVNARFAKPLDEDLILDVAGRTGRLVTVEENALTGGFGSAVLELLSDKGLSHVKVECLGIPDSFVGQGPQDLFRSRFFLDADGIACRLKEAFPDIADRRSIATGRSA
jgi:1-deoxy-D-xylulose-5-phosphate synthase